MGREAQGEWAKGKGPKSQGLGTCSRSGGRWGSDRCGRVSLAGFPAGHEAWGPGGGLFVENGSKAGLLNLLFSNLCFLTCATALLRPSPLPRGDGPQVPGAQAPPVAAWGALEPWLCRAVGQRLQCHHLPCQSAQLPSQPQARARRAEGLVDFFAGLAPWTWGWSWVGRVCGPGWGVVPEVRARRGLTGLCVFGEVLGRAGEGPPFAC